MEVKANENDKKGEKNIKVTETKDNVKNEKPETKVKESEKEKEVPVTFSQLWGGINYII
jgi:hypothetical protein